MDSNNNEPFIIAEIGVNHNGSIDNAKKLISAALFSGADAVKFQTFNSNLVVSENTNLAEYQKDSTTAKNQYELIKKLELTKNDFLEIKKYCDEIGIEFISTPFDLESLEFLIEGLKVKKLKLSSCDLNNINLLWNAAKYELPMIISTGMANLEEIETALAIIIHSRTENKVPSNLEECKIKLIRYQENKEFLENITILHCTTAYPCPTDDVNLKAMHTIQNKFGLKVGYSDHSIGHEVCLAATSMGATVLEKHFTLSRKMEGPDHKASMEPNDFLKMTKSIRIIKRALGKSDKIVSKAEINNCKIAKRSIYAKQNISKGKIIQVDDLVPLRPEDDDAVPASKFFDLIGLKSKISISKGDYIPKNIIEY